MNTASLDLCKELFSYSHDTWGDLTDFQWAVRDMDSKAELVQREYGKSWPKGYYTAWPAYDLGYLLRQLPQRIKTATLVIEPSHNLNPDGWWNARYSDERNLATKFGETPEDTLCELAIELFKQKVLK